MGIKLLVSLCRGRPYRTICDGWTFLPRIEIRGYYKAAPGVFGLALLESDSHVLRGLVNHVLISKRENDVDSPHGNSRPRCSKVLLISFELKV